MKLTIVGSVCLLAVVSSSAEADRRTSPSDRLHADAFAFRLTVGATSNPSSDENDAFRRLGIEWWPSGRLALGASISQSSPMDESDSDTSLNSPVVYAVLNGGFVRPAADVLLGVGVDVTARLPIAVGDSFTHRPGLELGAPVVVRHRYGDYWLRPRAGANAGDYRDDGKGFHLGFESGFLLHFSRLSIGPRGSADRTFGSDANDLTVVAGGGEIAVEIVPGATVSFQAMFNEAREAGLSTGRQGSSALLSLEIVWYQSDRKNALRARPNLKWGPCSRRPLDRSADSVDPARRREGANGSSLTPCQ